MKTMTDLVRDSSRAELDPEWIRGALSLVPPERLAGVPELHRILLAESHALYLSQRYPKDSEAARQYWWTMTAMHLGRAFAHHQGRCVAHVFRPAACALVASTDLRDMPSEPPRLLRGPWLLTGSAGPLFGDTLELGGYVDGEVGGIRLVGRFDDSGVVATSWRPEWGERFSFKLPREADKAESKNPEAAAAWGAEAARFAVMAGLLLDAEGTPFQPRDEVEKARRDARAKKRREADWITRHVYLDQTRARVREGSAEVRPANTSGLVAERVEVRGHLRNQPCGPKAAERKWVYVAPFRSTRWVREGDVRVVTHARVTQAGREVTT